MAINPITYEEMREIFAEYFGGKGGGVGASGNSAGNTSSKNRGSQRSADLGAEFEKLMAESRKVSDAMSKSNRLYMNSHKAHRDFADAVYENKRALSALERELEAVQSGAKQLTAEQKKELEARVKSHRSVKDGVDAQEIFKSNLDKGSSATLRFSAGIIGAASSIAGAIQGSASGFGIASSMLTAGAEGVNSAITTAGTGAQAAGGMLMRAGGGAKIAGVALMGLGTIANTVGPMLLNAFKAVNGIVTSEGERLLSSYKTATSAGAILADGANDMQASLKGSVYSLNDYSEMVKANAGLLSQSNMGVGQASMLFGRVNKELGPTSKALVALGVDFKDQGAIIAEVVADMRRRDPNAEINEKVVAQRTRDYAINLATLSNLTGESASALREANKETTGQMAFQQFLNGLGEQGPAVEQAFKALSPAVAKNVSDIINFGGVINKQGAVMSATNPALASMQNELAAAAKSGQLNQQLAEEIQAKYKNQINDRMMSDRGLALAMAAPESNIAALGVESMKTRDHIMKMGTAAEARAAAEKQLADAEAKLKSGQSVAGDLTGTFVTMNGLGQELKTTLTNTVISSGLLELYTDALKKAVKEIPEAVSKMKDEMLSGGFSLKDALIATGAAIAAATSFIKPTTAAPATPAAPTPMGRGAPSSAGATGGISAELAEAAKNIKSANPGMTSQQALEAARKAASSATATPTPPPATAEPTAPKGRMSGARVLGPAVAVGVEGYISYEQWQEAERLKKEGVISAEEANKRKGKAAGGGIGGAGGAIGGAAYGASLGIAGGPIGIAVGGILGGIIGGLVGRSVGEAAGGAVAGAISTPSANTAPGTTTVPGQRTTPPATATPTPVQTPPATAAPVPAVPARPPGPTSMVPEDLRQLASSVQVGTYTGIITGLAAATPQLTQSINNASQFAMNAALNPAKDFLTQVTAASESLKAARNVAPAPTEQAAVDPAKTPMGQLLVVAQEQAAQIRKLVEQQESMMAFYRTSERLQTEATVALNNSNDTLSKISRSLT